MRPEEIDKIFKERLGSTTPTPPADLWNRLQDRMEAEMPQQLKPKEEKKSFMWIYSSVAATLSLLLTVGVVFYNIKSTPEVSDTLALKDKTILLEEPMYNAPVEEAVAQVEAIEKPAEKKSEIISEPRATKEASPASNITEAVERPATLAKAKTKAVQQTKAARANTASQPTAQVQQALAQNTPTTESPAEAATVIPTGKPVMPSALAASADMNAKPVEITIVRSAAPAIATAVAEEKETGGLEKKAKLAKNIFKQARNLANGEQVQLADLGIRADRVALETQIGKQKISKVINL
ncbi:hypothetical protein [uncultured Pontibacter sp.]|uniref:hypothetical protein n=1 Tax=uncultured Pontibacter sp. TaxID=453356 RepID=UPI00262CE6F6|nr:hypothetical protein [uncultured Pontibacter sp.]